MRRLFRFAYPLRGRKDRELFPYQLRDGEAALHMVRKLHEMGYTYVGPIINYPYPYPIDPGKDPELIPFDLSIFRPDDLLLLCTRHPMNDIDWGTRHHIQRSFTVLEDKLFKGPLSRWFKECARHLVRLTDEAAAISPEIAARKSLQFHQHGGAAYQAYGCGDNWVRFNRKSTPATAAFLSYAEHAWDDGPGLLTAFGMGGVETLVWAYQLSTRFPDLLCKTRFALAEITYGPPTDLADPLVLPEKLDKWNIRILGQA
jgi:hypothetical protein